MAGTGTWHVECLLLLLLLLLLMPTPSLQHPYLPSMQRPVNIQVYANTLQQPLLLPIACQRPCCWLLMSNARLGMALPLAACKLQNSGGVCAHKLPCM
jgi:hypothetical protein